MKVLHIITGLNDGGAEAVLHRLVSKSRNYNHVVVSLMDEGKYGPLLEGVGVKVFCLRMAPGRLSVGSIWQLRNVIVSESPDVVQTWMYHADFLGGIAAKMAGVKKI